MSNLFRIFSLIVLLTIVLLTIVLLTIVISCRNVQSENPDSIDRVDTDTPSAKQKTVPPEVMEEIYQEIKTPFKYGVVFQEPDTNKIVDSPTVYRSNGSWYMTYIVYEAPTMNEGAQGYETWLAKSEDLLNWKIIGRIMSFTENTWDANQKAGYLSLVDIEWGGSYEVEKFDDKYWMSYLGGANAGYEAGTLGVGLASSNTITSASEWERLPGPIFLPTDDDARFFEKKTIYKSLIIRDGRQLTGFPFIMYYNAKGPQEDWVESIGMAVSDDMLNWKRFGGDEPLVTRGKGICGDAQIAKIDDLYVMFYFGAHYREGAFERFACSYDLVNWTDWQGEDLIAPSEDYDSTYAHKPWVIKWAGIVYHFYTAVGSEGRVIALATSEPM